MVKIIDIVKQNLKSDKLDSILDIQETNFEENDQTPKLGTHCKIKNNYTWIQVSLTKCKISKQIPFIMKLIFRSM